MTGPDIDKLCADLKRDEGCRLKAYWDDIGKCWTIGFGHTGPEVVEGLIWTQEESGAQLEDDVLAALDDCSRQTWWAAVKDDEVRARAMVNACFNLGLARLSLFKNTLYAIEIKDWDDAYMGFIQSLWNRQLPNRVRRIAMMIRTGRDTQ